MPIYEYKCENGHTFDIMQRISDDPLAACVECGAPVRKVLHPVGIAFKGSGFYSTDYSSNGKANGNGSKPEKSEASTEKASTKAGSGPASKDKD